MNIREWTLPVFTILLQLAAGVLISLWIVRAFNKRKIGLEVMDQISRYPLVVVFVTILTAMIGAHFHLSQPLLSILSVLNFRSAWLSREIAFTIFFLVFTAGLLDLTWYIAGHNWLKDILGWITILFGFLTIYSMGSVYLLRTQPVWNTPVTMLSFFGTTILLGVTALPLIFILDIKFIQTRSTTNVEIRQMILKRSLLGFTIVAALAAGAIIACNLYNVAYLRTGNIAAQTGLQLLFGLYKPLLDIRILTAGVGLCLCLYVVLKVLWQNKPVNELVPLFFLSFMLIMVSEVLGRILFYATSVRIGL